MLVLDLYSKPNTSCNMSLKLSIVSLILILVFSCSRNELVERNSLKASISDFSINSNKIKAKKGDELITGDEIFLDVYSTVERLCFSVSLQTISDSTIVIMGRKGGGYIEFRNDSVHTYQLDSKLQDYVLYESSYLRFNSCESINIECNKNNSHTLEYLITTQDTIYKLAYDKNSLDPSHRRVALAWGKPFLKIKKGAAKVESAFLSSDYSLNSKITVIGDSFIEGATMVDYGLDYRWCALLAKSIGEDLVPIIGKGGERIDSEFIKRFKIENSWYKTPYIIISLGTNNQNVDSYIEDMTELINIIKANGQIPILTTVTPRPGCDYNTITKIMNDWVRTSGEAYVDMHKSVTKLEDPSQWKDIYVQNDGVHPSKLGHLAMFRQLKLDCPILFHL